MFRPAETESESEIAGESAVLDGCSMPSQTAARSAGVAVPKNRLAGSADNRRGSRIGVPARPRESSAYGRAFWLSYLSLTTLMIAVSLMYRYADFVTFLGGSELDLGAIVGVGMVGSLVMRLAQGVGIDRYGPRHIWLGSTMLFIASMLGHLVVSRANGPGVYLLHVLFRTSVAGVFGAAFTFAFQQVPISRMTEAVGTVGTASFVGIVVGPRVGDWISAANGRAIERGELDKMFLVAAAFGSVSFIAAWFATLRAIRPRRRLRMPIVPLLRRYHPGVLLAIGVVTGIALGMPATFLRTFAAELQFDRIAPFFTVYALTAIGTRLATRRMADELGVRAGVLIGMALVTAGILSYLLVSAEWHLMIPALLTGAGQAILYPAVVAGGSAVFPNRCRGVGTTLMLAMIDLGTLVGAPLIGGIVYFGKQLGLPGYSLMFVAIAAIVVASSVYYAIVTRGAKAA
jgi:MFS family permease